jgi:hypothetical protein
MLEAAIIKIRSMHFSYYIFISKKSQKDVCTFFDKEKLSFCKDFLTNSFWIFEILLSFHSKVNFEFRLEQFNIKYSFEKYTLFENIFIKLLSFQ